MYPNTQILFNHGTAIRAFLTGAIGVNLTVENTALSAHPRQHLIHELPQSGIQGMLTQHPFCHDAKVDIFDKDHPGSVAEMMCQLKVKIAPTICNLFMHSGYLLDQFATVIRSLLLVSQSALQQFQLTVQFKEKARTLNLFAIRSRQKILQSDIDPYRMTLWYGIRNGSIRLHHDRHVPARSLANNPSRFQSESVRDGAMQINHHLANLGQFNLVSLNCIAVNLGEQKRFELPNLLKTGKALPSLLHSGKGSVNSANDILKHLRMHGFQAWIRFFGFGQCLLLTVIVRVRRICQDDVFRLERADIDRAFPTVDPVFPLTQRIVIDLAAGFQPIQHLEFLRQVWINAIAVSQCQHNSIVLFLEEKEISLRFLVELRRLLFASGLRGSHPDTYPFGVECGASRLVAKEGGEPDEDR